MPRTTTTRNPRARSKRRRSEPRRSAISGDRACRRRPQRPWPHTTACWSSALGACTPHAADTAAARRARASRPSSKICSPSCSHPQTPRRPPHRRSPRSTSCTRTTSAPRRTRCPATKSGGSQTGTRRMDRYVLVRNALTASRIIAASSRSSSTFSRTPGFQTTLSRTSTAGATTSAPCRPMCSRHGAPSFTHGPLHSYAPRTEASVPSACMCSSSRAF